MPEYTRPATWEDLKRLAKLLNEANAEYALVGGYAIAAHGFNRQSEDIDLLVNPVAENSRRWIVALSHLPDQAIRALEQDPDVFADDKRYALRVRWTSCRQLPDVRGERCKGTSKPSTSTAFRCMCSTWRGFY